MHGLINEGSGKSSAIRGVPAVFVLRDGFGGKSGCLVAG
jgi:hypothetical protein